MGRQWMFAGFYSDLHGRRKPSFGQFWAEVTCPCQPLSLPLAARFLSLCVPPAFVCTGHFNRKWHIERPRSGKQSSPATRHGGAWGERRYSSYSFLTSALDGGEWSASRPDRALPRGKDPWYPGWALEPVWTQRLEENPLPLPGIEPRSDLEAEGSAIFKEASLKEGRRMKWDGIVSNCQKLILDELILQILISD
jgi:hypothetical protein